MKVLVTGFDPFNNDSVNPSWEAVKLLKNEIAGAEIIKLQVPTVFHKSIRVIREAMDRERPDVVLSVGQAYGRGDITPERVGINLSDASFPDNEGYQPTDEPVFADGADGYFSNLPVKAMVEGIRAKGIPASASTTAGTFVCNHVLYGVQYHIHRDFPGIRSGFIHIPCLPCQTVSMRGMPSMSLADDVIALEAAIEAVVTHDTDIDAVGGSVS